MDFIHAVLKLQLLDIRLFHWTDSYTVLCWIHIQNLWKQYVLRRVKEIHKLIIGISVQVRSCNPADIPS